MEDLIEPFSWYFSEPRYHRLKLTPLAQALPEQETLRVSSFDDEEDTKQVATPGTLRKSPPERATARLPQPGGMKLQPKKPIEQQATLKMPSPNGLKQQGERSIAQQATLKMPSPNGLKQQGERSIAQQATLKMPQPDSVKPWESVRPENYRQVGIHETFGFDIDVVAAHDDPEFDKLSTIPVMVLRDISKQQHSPQPVMKSDISHAAGSAAYVSIGNIGGSILKYGSNVVIQRGFGAAAFGLYTIGMSLVTLVTAIFNLGLDDAMVRYVSIYRAKRKIASLRGLSIFCTAVAGVSGILGALFMLFFAPYLAAIKHSSELAPLLVIMSPLVPLLCMQTIWMSGLQGFKEFKWRVLLQRILMPIILILLLLGALIFFHDLTAIVIATIIYGLIAALLSFYFFFRRIAGILKPGQEMYELRDWLGFAAPNFLTSIVETVLQSIDTLLLAFFAIPNVAIGQYAAAIKISNFITMPLLSFNAMFAPTIAELHSQGEHEKLAAMFKVVTKWTITFSLPIFGIATLFSPTLLGLSGQSFIPAWPLVVAFSIGSMANVGTGSVGYLLLMTGYTKTSFLNSLTAVIVNVVLGIILTPRYGAMGVAIATGLAMAVVNLMRLLQVRLLLKMQPYRWDVLKPLGAGVISTLLTGGLLYLLRLAHLSIEIGKAHLSFELSLVPVFLASYAGLLILFKISPEDQIVLDMLRRKFKRGKKNRKR